MEERKSKTLQRIAEKELTDFLAFGLGATEVEQRPDGSLPEPLLFGSLEQLMKEDAAVAGRLLYLLDLVGGKLIDLGANPLAAVEKVLGDDEVRISEGRMGFDEEEHRN